MEDERAQTKRPTIITVICIIGFIGAAFSLPLIFTTAKYVGSWYPAYLALSVIVGAISMIGLWKMKKWSVYLYTAFVAINQIVMISAGMWAITALLIPGVIIAIGFANLNKMD